MSGSDRGRGVDPGLTAAVPFTFSCHRCGHCCSGGSGHVWVQEEELPALAAARGMSTAAFVARFVRRVPRPPTGELALSLTEEGGRCALLEGANTCSVYAARPAHCREFPYWSDVLAGGEAFERARQSCPGIAVRVPPPVRRAAFAALEALYEEVDRFVAGSRSVCLLRGVCCRFEEAGHELFATALEADYAAHRHPKAPPPEAPGRCPYHVAGRCTARDGRPLGCRTYFCDRRTQGVLSEAHEHFLGRIRAIEREHGYPRAYGRFPALLAARGIGSGTDSGRVAEASQPSGPDARKSEE